MRAMRSYHDISHVLYSRLYNLFFPPLLRRFYGGITQEIGQSFSEAKILDVGSGPGALAITIVQNNPKTEMVGLDILEDMVKVASDNARKQGVDRIKFVCGDVSNLPFDDNAFDLLVSTFSLHHWPNVPKAISECHRVLRPGGELWVYDFNFSHYLRPGREFRQGVASSFFDPKIKFNMVKFGLVPMFVRYTVKR